MKNYHKLSYIIFFCMLTICLSGCLEEELAFEVLESPVLGLFEEMAPAADNSLKLKATFYELDKTNILDHTKGIDSIPLSGLRIQVYVRETELVGEYSTDSNGEIIFEEDYSLFQGSSRLEWAGMHKEIPFRIYKNL